MVLNKTGIDWCTRSWNPASHAERLNDPIKEKKPQSIFVCPMADLFGDWVPDLWIEMIFSEIQKAKQHTYLFLTKNPKRYLKIPGTYFTKNLWFGTTVTGIDDTQRICDLQKLPFANRFISFEPLLGDPGPMLDLRGIKQVIIGAQTNPTVMPPEGAINRVMSCAMWYENKDTKIFFKDSLYDDCHYVMRELHWQVGK